MFSFPALHFGVYFFKISRQRASWRVGFVLVHLILLRLDRIHTRHIGLRAANLIYPVGVSSVYCPRFSFSLSFSPFRSGFARGLSAPCGCLRPCAFPAVFGCLFVFSSLPLSLCFSPAVDLCVRLGSCLLFLSVCLSLYLSWCLVLPVSVARY